MDKLADFAELVDDFFRNFLIVRRIRKSPVEPSGIPWKNRACFYWLVQ